MPARVVDVTATEFQNWIDEKASDWRDYAVKTVGGHVFRISFNFKGQFMTTEGALVLYMGDDMNEAIRHWPLGFA